MNFIDSTNVTRRSIEHEFDPGPQKPKKTMKKILIGLFIVLFMGSLATAGFFYLKWTTLKNNPNKVVVDENKTLVDKVGKLILLPTGEDPTIATVSDLAPLKGQAFFKDAKIGFKVLVFDKAKLAYLYDPDMNRIINVSPVSGDAQAQSQTPAQTSGSSTTNVKK